MGAHALKTGARAHESATLMVGVCMALPSYMRPKTREVSAVFVPVADRRNGYASALVRAVCDEADDDNMTLVLTADEDKRGFYTRFGFIVIQQDIGLMGRMPGSTPRVLNRISAAVGDAIGAMQ